MLCDPFSVALFVCFLRGGGGGYWAPKNFFSSKQCESGEAVVDSVVVECYYVFGLFYQYRAALI